MWYTFFVVILGFAACIFVFGEAVRVRYQQPIERSNEHRIKKNILRYYDKTTRPVRSDQTQVQVIVAIALYHILDTNEKEQTFTSLISVRQRWKDEYLVWNASEYDGVNTIRVPANTIWTPDLVISNFAGDKFNDYMVTNAIVSSDGGVLWMFPALIKTYCTLNVKYFPFDEQKCELVFISWTHSGHELDVNHNPNFSNVVYYKSENQEWMVDGISTQQNIRYYACCTEPYPDVTFRINMRRGSLFYIVNLIAPCFLIFLISFLGFFLPVESGDKVNLETTILLALVVFLLMVGETMPPTPDAIPILGMFFASTMVMVTVALVMAVIVTNIYAKKESPERCPRWCIQIVKRFYPLVSTPDRLERVGSQPFPAASPATSHYPARSHERTKRRRKYAGCGGIEVVSTVADVIVASDSYAMHCCADATQATSGGSAYPDGESSSSTPSSPSCGCFRPPPDMAAGELTPAAVDTKDAYVVPPPPLAAGPSSVGRRFRRQASLTLAASVRTTGQRTARPAPPPPQPVGPIAAAAADDDPELDQATSEAEWRIVAKFTDRVFFWIFLALSTVTHCSLLMQMSPETRELMTL